MAETENFWNRPRFWIVLAGLIILLIFLYFFPPFEKYVVENVPKIRFDNIVFWFASLVGVIGFGITHWQSFRKNIYGKTGAVVAEDLVFETLQIAIMTAVIFCAGAILQSIVGLASQLLENRALLSSAIGEKLLAIVLLVILVIVFYLLHLFVRGFRLGWAPRQAPPRSQFSGGSPRS